MKWSNENCFAIIDQYEQFPIWWDPKNPFYFSKSKKDDAWESIVKNFNMKTAIEKKKISFLLSSFRAQWSNPKKTIRTGKSLFEKLHMGQIKILFVTLVL